jgi:60S ribosomal subunit assembly/export protein LOC1
MSRNSLSTNSETISQMAPTKSSGSKGGKGKPSGKAGGVSKKHAKPGSAPTGISKRKAKSMSLAKPGGAQKTKSLSTDGKKKKRVYTEEELNIPKLNGIVPAGVAKPKGQKKGKVFVDDPESMMAIMSVVNAEKEGHIESKIMRARQLEEVRQAKRKEQEKRSEEKKAKFEERKEGLKGKKKKRQSDVDSAQDVDVDNEAGKERKAKKKSVSFG